MDATTKLVAEDVVDQTVLGDTAQAFEARRRYDGIEVMAIAGDLGSAVWYAGLDAGLQLVWGGVHSNQA